MIIIHIITGLNNGGAERQLYNYLSNRKIKASIIVISLTNCHGSKYENLLRPLVDDVIMLDFNKKIIYSWLKLAKLLYNIKPSAVQTWMYHADFFGGITAKLFSNAKIFWNVRNGNIDRTLLSLGTFILVKINSILSKFLPDTIVYCAHSARVEHENFGYFKTKGFVIPNGIQIDKINYSKTKNVSSTNNVVKICNISRWHPHKDHSTLIEAFVKIDLLFSDIEFHFVGKGLDHYNSKLNTMLQDHVWKNKYFLHGEITKIYSFLSNMNLFVLSSVSEGFPNVILEAQLMNVFCISTDVGDVSSLIDSDWICAKKSPEELYIKIMNYLKLDNSLRDNILKIKIDNIITNYNINSTVSMYDEMYKSKL